MAEETQVKELGLEQGGANDGGQDQVSVEDLRAEQMRLKAELAKSKVALDKALHNNGELTKQLRQRMTAQEQEDEAKRIAAEAQQARMQDLENFKRKTEAKDRYMTIGMSQELAKEAAEAEVSGDMDALTDVYKRYNEASLKASKDEWLKNRPEPAMGRDEDGGKEDPFLAGFAKG